MSTKSYCYQFSETKVFAPDSAPLSFQIKGNFAFVAMNNYMVAVYDISISNIIPMNVFPVCGCVKKIDYCIFDDYIITLESKDHSDANTNLNNSIRTYHNWRNYEAQNKIRFRPALGTRTSSFNSGHSDNSDKSKSTNEYSFIENVIEALEFLHLAHPTGFSVFSNGTQSGNTKIPRQNYEDTSSNIAISENTYVHLYQFYPSNRRSLSSHSTLSPKLSQQKPNEIDSKLNETGACFQHLFTVNFSFIVVNLDFLSQVLVAASLQKVQAIQVLEEKQKSDMFSFKMEKANLNSVKQVEIDIEKCWLSSISNERKMAASKPKLKPKEILGPTQNLDTASITLLRYADSKEMSFQTLLFRKYVTGNIVKNIHLVKVSDFEKLGLFIVMKHEIVLYSFSLLANEVQKIAEYDFGSESVISMAFSENVNLIHVAFSNGDLATYNSRLCSDDLFQSSIISKRVSLTRLGKVTLMGLTDVKSNGLLVCACCKLNLTEENDIDNAIIVSPDSWNFYLFSQPLRSDLKQSIVAHATYKGTRKHLQMLLCSLLVFPSKDEINFKTLKEIVICCLKCDSSYMELVPSLLLRENMSIVEALQIFQDLETRELYNDNLFQLYAKKKLIKANFSELTENHFRWIVIKILNCSIDQLFNIIVTNDLEDFLKADLMTIEGIIPNSFQSAFIKILYYSAHIDYDLVEALLAQLDQKELKKLLKSEPHLIYNNKHHTLFGWVLNLYNPQIYAKVVASCILNEITTGHEFTYLEIAKQVGQCSHILVLEEIFHSFLKNYGFIPNSSKYCKSKFGNENIRSPSFERVTFDNSIKGQDNNIDSYKNYINQLLLLYHEFSFNMIEFCPHKINQTCKKIPSWLKSFRYHVFLNQFPPFNGVDPFKSQHNSSGKSCPSMCCQSYLLRLQCLMSWKKSFNLPGRNAIEASCESMNHPSWTSLNFLLFQHMSVEHRNIVDIVSFVNLSEKRKDVNMIDLYFSAFGKEITVTEWKMLLENPCDKGLLKDLLKYATTLLDLNEFLRIIESLKESKRIDNEEYDEWVERSGRFCHREICFSSILKQIMDESL